MSGNICAATNSPSPCSKATTTSSTNPAPRGASSPTTPNASHQSHPEPGRRSILEAVGMSWPTAVINAPVDVVWALLMEPAAWGGVFNVRVGSIDPPGPAIVGQKICGETGLRILHLKLTFRMIEIDLDHQRPCLDVQLPLGIMIHEDRSQLYATRCDHCRVIRCGPSRCLAWDAPAGLKNFVRQPEKTFSTASVKGYPQAASALSLFTPSTADIHRLRLHGSSSGQGGWTPETACRPDRGEGGSRSG